MGEKRGGGGGGKRGEVRTEGRRESERERWRVCERERNHGRGRESEYFEMGIVRVSSRAMRAGCM